MSRLLRVLRAGSGIPILLVALLLAPSVLTSASLSDLMLTLMLGLVAYGINLTMGYAGQFALSHVFLYGAATYAAAILATRQGVTNIGLLLLIGIGVSVVLAALTGVPGFHLGGWTLGLVSFFLVEIFGNVVSFAPGLTGGSTGIVGIPQLSLGETLDNSALFRVTAVLLCAWMLVQRNVIASGYGRIFASLRADELQVSALGVSSYRLKLFAYVLSAVPAGIAGVAFAGLDGFVSPTSFTVSSAIVILAALVAGGKGTLYGPLLGTYIIVEVQQRMLSFTTFTQVAFGGFLVIAAIVIPRGLVGAVTARLPQRLRSPLLTRVWRERPVQGGLGPVLERSLVVRGVSKRFGGVQALDAVSISADAGRVTALIGPNGSGKTTLLNLVCGYYRVDAGTAALGDDTLTGIRPERVARAGVGRTFQTPRLPDGLTARETVATAAFSSRRYRLLSVVLRLPGWWEEERRLADRVAGILDELGLGDVADELAQSLPLGKKRLVEIARAIVMRPSLLVLDEAASGLDPEETELLGTLLRRLAAEGTAVLLVEHNMSLVMSTAHHVFVLADGRLLTEGPPDAVASHPDVLAVYLGDDAAKEDSR